MKAWTMFNKTVLDNGVRIISERLDHLRSVSLSIWVNTGSRDEEKEKNGITHFVEHMLFRGTRNRTGLEIAKELDAIGGLSNAFTGKEHTCFHARVLDKHFRPLAEILSDIYLNSIFAPEDMERERQVILQEVNMVEDTPDDNIHVLFNREFWRDHPMGMSILGTGETVSAIDKKDIMKYFGECYGPERVLIVAAGNVDHEEMVSYFRPLFETLEERASDCKRRVPLSRDTVSVYFKDLEQVHLCLGGEAPSLRSDDRYTCAILNTLLGGNMSSRLFQEIREKKGLAYCVYSYVSSYIDTGLLGIYMATDRESVDPALETVQHEIKKIKRGELASAEVDAAKEHLMGGVYLASESSDNRMMRVAKNELIFERYISSEELVSSLAKVSVDDVIEVADRIFQDGGVSLAALGPLKEEELDKSTLQFDSH